MTGLSVGQQLWFAPGDTVKGTSFVTVTKAGRKSADLSNGMHLDTRTMIAYQGNVEHSMGRCWLSREEWATWAYRVALWRELSKTRRWKLFPPNDVSVEDIQEAARLLGIDLSDVSPPAEQGVTDAG